jgi:nucleoid-associated protein YgaU|tara:strand:- start:235 stop:570 length:336 start_codon:yes stop_codon:yes gene_type:complete
MSRYNNTRILTNASDYYAPLRKERDIKVVRQYATPVLANPTVAQRASLKKIAHVWKYGDRLYQLAHKYYGDSRFWWVIAWYNGYGVEADILPGARLSIPVSLEKVLQILRA